MTGPIGVIVRDPDELARLLRSRRRDLGLSLKQVGERAGCGLTQVSRVERGLVRPSAGMLLRIADALELYVAVMPQPDRRAAD